MVSELKYRQVIEGTNVGVTLEFAPTNGRYKLVQRYIYKNYW